MPQKGARADRTEMFRTLVQVSQVGWRMVGSILAGFGLGLLLDRHFRTGGWLLVPFLICGIIVGFVSCYRVVMRVVEDECRSKDQ